MTPLTEWTSFYGVMGTAAGSLTGLQFVMMALVADLPATPGQEEAGDAFASPTIVHFSAVLFLTAIAVMPWHSLTPPSVIWGSTGGAGLIYTTIVIRRMHAQSAYKPVLEDWLFHMVFPVIAYALLLAAACATPFHSRPGLFTLAAAGLLLLFIGVHNAWDSAVYIVFTRKRELRRDH